MHLPRRAGLAAGVLLALACALPSIAAAAPANVTVRVEGARETLLPSTVVRTTNAPVVKDGTNACPGTTALGALDRATRGEWAGRWDPNFASYLVDSIEGEAHTSAPGAQSGTYWAFWVNYRYAASGLCATELQEGDQVLLFPDCFGPTCVNPTPLRLRAPAVARAGRRVAVRVTEQVVAFDANFNATTREQPAADATVTASDGRRYTTGRQGIARIPAAGEAISVRAEKRDRVRSATEVVCVTAGRDGRCGTRDRRGPAVRLTSVEDGKTYRRRAAPRRLAGRVAPDPAGLRAVRLRLTRDEGRTCVGWSGAAERFVDVRCGRGPFFDVGDRARWSYLLPERLGPGRYALEVVAVDNRSNRSRTRARFTVR